MFKSTSHIQLIQNFLLKTEIYIISKNLFWTLGNMCYVTSISGSDGKESTCNEGDSGLIPGSGRSLGEGNGNPLQYSCLEEPSRLQSTGS